MSDDSILLQDIARCLNTVSWDILDMLSKNERLSYGEIKDKLKISQNKVSKEIARLEGALLICSTRNSIDARVNNYEISKNGMNILKLK